MLRVPVVARIRLPLPSNVNVVAVPVVGVADVSCCAALYAWVVPSGSCLSSPAGLMARVAAPEVRSCPRPSKV
ncbi:hypothetical protein [Dactylosporangium siamense]|uniref:hypothetical protein n=1 Tax=Dactylosporangium siamense TaxID=685454 RepID=UPI001EF1E8ED|nr:hypothetical protein [Dactylosporangium siamense]